METYQVYTIMISLTDYNTFGVDLVLKDKMVNTIRGKFELLFFSF